MLDSQLLHGKWGCVYNKRGEFTNAFLFNVPLRLRIEPSCCVEVGGGGGKGVFGLA